MVQIDHLKLTKTECGYQGILMMIDHFTKYAVAAPYKDGTAKEVIKLVTQFWIAPFGTPIFIQCDNGPLFTAHVTREFMKINDISQVFASPYHPQSNGLVERQNRTLISMLRVVCSRYQTDWCDHLATVMGAYNSTRQ